MLNISQNTIKHKIPTDEFTSLNANHLARFHKVMVRWIVGVMLFGLAVLFLPWTQNIQSEGQVTALSPEQRPQTVPANIDGRIEKWYVQEGQLVQKGDTIAYISEIKTEYADPNLVENTQDQITAKNS
ncbi:MAG: biotin/lipoyl-binding protein, partial [Bacteroidota bacterium]